MASIMIPQNAYTDSPELNPNLFLGAFQILGWLFFHPSAWANYVSRMDTRLLPNFCLAELKIDQWRNPGLTRLILTGYVVYPLALAFLVGPVLWVLGAAFEEATIGILSGLALGVILGITTNLAVGITTTLISGATMAIFLSIQDVILVDAVFGVAFGWIFGVLTGMAGYVTGNIGTRGINLPLPSQISSVVIGIFVSGISLLVLGGLFYITTLTSQFGIAYGSEVIPLVGIILGILLGVAVSWRTRSWRRGVVFCFILGVVIWFIFTRLIYGFEFGQEPTGKRLLVLINAVASGTFIILYVIPASVAERNANSLAGAIAGGLGSLATYVGLGYFIPYYSLGTNVNTHLVIMVSGFAFIWLRPVFMYPFSIVATAFLYRADERRRGNSTSWLRWHPAFWDENQRLPLIGLDDHLVLFTTLFPAEGQTAIEYLSTSRQRWAAREAQVELDARQLESYEDVKGIGNAYTNLAAEKFEGAASALLRSFARIGQDIRVALSQGSTFNQRLTLVATEDRLDNLLRELTRSQEKYAVRFRPIASRWRQFVSNHVQHLTETVEIQQEIDNPYIISVPLTEQQEIFVGRIDISARLERLLLDRRHPPLLLYGQRRMGKTSLLNNLGRLLPNSIIPLFVDLQGPVSFASDYAGLLYNIARGMSDTASRKRGLVLPKLSREELTLDPFTRFDEWLDEVEQAADTQNGNTILLALDEFEALDNAISEGRFQESILMGMLRHIIQHRTHFKVLLAGSHTLQEFQRWASYLINAQIIHISYLNEGEARQLIEQPIQGFSLSYEPDALQRVLELTRCHPFLVQLLCAEIVTLKNEQNPSVRRLARLNDIEMATTEALTRGSLFFADIERNQIDEQGLAILNFLAARGERIFINRETLNRQFPHFENINQTLSLLKRRELIEQRDGGYGFQVELIRRWFAREDR